MSEKFLFLGGPADGQWRETDRMPEYRVVWSPPFNPGKWDEPTPYEFHHYRAMPFQAGPKRWLVYIYSELKIEEAFQILLEGYQAK